MICCIFAIAELYHIVTECWISFCALSDQYPTLLLGNRQLMTSSVAKARRVVSNSSSSSLKADTEDFPGAGKYSASMPHLDVQLVVLSSFEKREILRCTCFWKYSLIEVSLHVFCSTKRSHAETTVTIRLLLHETSAFKAIMSFLCRDQWTNRIPRS